MPLIDKSTIPAKQYCRKLGYGIIDAMDDGEKYVDKNGKRRTKKNLGCDFWIKKEGQTKSVEAKCKMGNFAGLVPHQIDRLIEGGFLAIVDLKDNSVKLLTWSDIRNRSDILEQLKLKNSRVTIGSLRAYY